jgi:hypothetical protein
MQNVHLTEPRWKERSLTSLNVAMEDNEEMDREGSENENEAGEEGDNQDKKEYVKKEFFAKPYVSKFGNASETEVRSLTTKNQR